MCELTRWTFPVLIVVGMAKSPSEVVCDVRLQLFPFTTLEHWNILGQIQDIDGYL